MGKKEQLDHARTAIGMAMDYLDQPRYFWVDPGDGTIPMSVIDQAPALWQDKITGTRVRPEHYGRFVKCVEVIEPDKCELKEG